MRLSTCVLLLPALMAVPTLAHAADCRAFLDQIERSLKYIAVAEIDSISDESAPRRTMHRAEIANLLLEIQINLNLLALNKCPPPERPISKDSYLVAANACRKAEQAGRFDAPECRRQTWQRTD